jgi:hypothetical protein
MPPNSDPPKSRDQLIGEIHATVKIMAADLKDTRTRLRCLEQKWWKSFGVVTGIVAFISIISTGVGIYSATKRMEADYIRKDMVPVSAIVEHQNKVAKKRATEEGTDGVPD